MNLITNIFICFGLVLCGIPAEFYVPPAKQPPTTQPKSKSTKIPSTGPSRPSNLRNSPVPSLTPNYIDFSIVETGNSPTVSKSPTIQPLIKTATTTPTTNSGNNLQCRYPRNSAKSNIKHLIVIITENHSFDSYFGRYCNATTYSNPKCNYGKTCCERAPSRVNGKAPYTLTDTQNLAFNPTNTMATELCEINGGAMDKYMSNQGCTGGSDQNFAIADAFTLSTYYRNAKQFAIADRYFQSSAGSSPQNDIYLASGAPASTTNDYVPKSSIGAECYPSSMKVSYTEKTIVDLLVACNTTWAMYMEGYDMIPSSLQCYPNYYDSSYIPFAFFKSVADNPKYFKDLKNFFSDVSSGILPSVSYFKSLGINSGQPGISTLTAGQYFSDNIVQTILASKRYNNNTLILITPGGSGGYYDHVNTPPTNPIDGRSYGARIPLIAIGKMVKRSYISHVQMEASSIIKFIEWNWLGGSFTGQLGTRDTNVNNIGDLLNPLFSGMTVPAN